MEINIKQNQKNITRSKKLWNDKLFNKLVDLTLQNRNSLEVLTFIRGMLYLDNKEDYINYYNHAVISSSFYKEISNIYLLFLELNLYNESLSNIRGIFLELLNYKVIKKLSKTEKLYRESRICIDNFQSYYFDLIVVINNLISVYECKFSSRVLKRSTLNLMFGLKNKYNLIRLYLIFFDFKKQVFYNLLLLQEDTNIEKYDNMLNSFNVVSLEEFGSDESFIS